MRITVLNILREELIGNFIEVFQVYTTDSKGLSKSTQNKASIPDADDFKLDYY